MCKHVHRLTQTEMAVLVNSAHEVVSRGLKELESTGVITMRHGQAIVLGRETLRMMDRSRSYSRAVLKYAVVLV